MVITNKFVTASGEKHFLTHLQFAASEPVCSTFLRFAQLICKLFSALSWVFVLPRKALLMFMQRKALEAAHWLLQQSPSIHINIRESNPMKNQIQFIK